MLVTFSYIDFFFCLAIEFTEFTTGKQVRTLKFCWFMSYLTYQVEPHRLSKKSVFVDYVLDIYCWEFFGRFAVWRLIS